MDHTFDWTIRHTLRHSAPELQQHDQRDEQFSSIESVRLTSCPREVVEASAPPPFPDCTDCLYLRLRGTRTRTPGQTPCIRNRPLVKQPNRMI